MGKGLPIREAARARSQALCGPAPLAAHTWLGGVEAIFWLVLTVWVFVAFVLDPLFLRLLAS